MRCGWMRTAAMLRECERECAYAERGEQKCSSDRKGGTEGAFRRHTLPIELSCAVDVAVPRHESVSFSKDRSSAPILNSQAARFR